MTTGTALALAAMLALALSGQPPVEKQPGSHNRADPPEIAAHDPVLSEMGPAPGHWEVEDAPAYFSDRQGIADAPAPGEPSAGTASGETTVAHRRP